MKTVAFALQKGGVGKTSVSVTVTHMAAELGRHVLLVDADPQGSASGWLLTEAPRYELVDVLTGAVALNYAVTPITENLDLLASIAIGGGLRRFADTQLEQLPYAFGDLTAGSGYDLVVYDTSPANGRLETSVLRACDEVVPVITAEIFSVDGLELFREFVAEIESSWRVHIDSPRMVLNQTNDSFRRHKSFRHATEQLGLDVFEVHQDSQVPEAQMANVPLPSSARAAVTLRALAEAL